MSGEPGAASPSAASTRASIASELRWAAAALAAAGIENARLEARVLLRHALGVGMETLIGHPERTVEQHDQAMMRALVTRRLAREPLAYIVGTREFWSLPFQVTPDTLVPRPESETLIEAALARIADRRRPLRIVDLGTGSGCLLLTLLSELPAAWGLGIDLSAAALAVAQNNAGTLGLAGRAAWMRGNWGDAIGVGFDLIVANPPYIAESELPYLAPEVAQFEPRLALNGGRDGLDSLRAIVPALHHLGSPDSLFVVEIGAGQSAAAAALLRDFGLQNIETIDDLAGIPRCLAARPNHDEKKAWKPYSSRLLFETSQGRQALPPMGASNGTNKPADIPYANGCPQVGSEGLRVSNAAEFLSNGGMFAANTLGMR